MTNILPAHLQHSKRGRISDHATEGMGSSLPSHISIRGNRFTLIDQSGTEKPVETLHLDVCIADISDKICKLYYGKDYEAGSNDPPLCFSANGVAPSKDAAQPQNADCQSCQWNVRGSATSKLSGQPIKACRDEKWLAVLVPSIPNMVFQFRVTPGSFKNFKSYKEKFNGQPFDMKDCLTRLEFEPNSNGVIKFSPQSFIDDSLAAQREKAYEGNVTDLYVGRLDQPRLVGPASMAGNMPSAQVAPAPAALPNFVVTNTPRPGESTEQTEARKTRGRPKKEAAQQPAAATSAPFASGPTQAPFGIQADAPEPPNAIAEGMKSFFNE